MSDNDEMVSQFMAFTGSADPGRAASYLEMSGGHLETAVGLYMEHEAGSAHGAGGAGGGDAAAAAAAVDASMMNPDDVRAPDETRTMRLMDDNSHYGIGHPMHAAGGSMHPEYQLMRDMMEEQLASSAFAAEASGAARAALNAAVAGRAAASSDDDDDEYDYGEAKMEEDDDNEVQVVGDSSSQPARLSDMFAAPTHLIHKAGGFQGARTVAKDSKRWLLVNIQKDSEFASHALNRDVWRDELAENLIREGFIFWQQMDTTPEGQTYITRYQVNDFPHVAFIDPRTGRLMWRKEGWTQENPLTAELFAEIAMDFCSRNSFDRPPQAPRPATAASRPAKRPVNEMSEDEQLQAAMQASMTGASTSTPVTNGTDNKDDDVEYLGTGEDAKPAAKEAEEEKQPSMVDELLKMTVSDEPSKGARIQFRLPDGGKRIVRKFDPSDVVKTIYAFVAQTVEEARNGRDFVLMAGFPPNDLAIDIDKSIEECKLAGQAITVRWKE